MGGPGWMFWLFPLMFFGMFWGGFWRRDRWAARRGRDAGAMSAEDRAALLAELDDQRAYAESLETRLAQLEERLDFAERLLAQSPAAALQPRV